MTRQRDREGTNKMDEAIKRGKEWLFEKDRWVTLTVALGLLGMLLILGSALWPGGRASPDPVGDDAAEVYIQKTEQRLSQLLGQVEGVGQVQVMVTLEQESERVYAKEEKQNTDKSMNYNGENPVKVEERGTSEAKYILVEASAGGKQPLLLSVRQPKVRGVIVVCQGGKDPVVQQQVTEVVTTALDISAGRVCVIR